MIPAWMLKRAGEVESFLKLLHKEHQLRPVLEIYQTSNGDAIGINYTHPFFHELDFKIKEIMVGSLLNSSSSDSEIREMSSLFYRWNTLSSWRAYKSDKAGGCWSSGLRVWYCSDVEENDIKQLRELYDWIDGGFTQEEFDLLKEYSDQNKEKKDNEDFQHCSKMVDELLKNTSLHLWYFGVKETINLVEAICESIDKERMRSIAQTLKLPLKSISDNPEIAETFMTIKKLQYFTSKNIELIDAYDELSALVRGKRENSYVSPMRRAKDLLKRIKQDLRWADIKDVAKTTNNQ